MIRRIIQHLLKSTRHSWKLQNPADGGMAIAGSPDMSVIHFPSALTAGEYFDGVG
jgi:hypothetical protein